MDPRALCHRLRGCLVHYGSVQGVYGYAAKKTWNPVPPALLEQYGSSGRRRLEPGVFRWGAVRGQLPGCITLHASPRDACMHAAAAGGPVAGSCCLLAGTLASPGRSLHPK